MAVVELSLNGIFFQSTAAIQAVLLLLGACSVLCWAVILEKSALLWRFKRQARGFDAWARQGSLSAQGPSGEISQALASQCRAAWSSSQGSRNKAESRDFMERSMRDALAERLLNAETRLPYLATIGSVAPFIGLFGTVWGIMHAFLGIAQSNDTSLAVIAPGIAESLFTTAAGLIAAIPASIGYNKLVSDFNLLSRRLCLSISALARRAGESSLEAFDDAA